MFGGVEYCIGLCSACSSCRYVMSCFNSQSWLERACMCII